MKCKIENCYYGLVKDLLMSQDSLIADVEDDYHGVIVTLKDGRSQDDLKRFLRQGPLQTFCAYSSISKL